MSAPAPWRVLVAGGGVAGLEALLALRHLAGERVALTLLEPAREFVYRPMAVAEPFARGRAARHEIAAIAADLDVELHVAALAAVDVAGRAVQTTAGERLPYDALLVAVGARSEPAYRHALTWTPETDPELFTGLLRDVDEGYTKSVAFVVPPGVAWALPAYELALMTAWQAWGMGHDDVQVSIHTPEDAPLGLFGPGAAAAVREDLEEAGIEVETGVYVAEDGAGGLALHPGERRLEAERVVALPRAAGPAVPGLPADRRGFLPCDLHGAVSGAERVWAAGDAIAFPVKQGGLASQEADAAAEAIAAAAGAAVEPAPFRPVIRGRMLTGRGSRWMRTAITGGDGEGTETRHALWWPPTKIAGRYLSPYLAALEGADPLGQVAAPPGAPVELDLERDLAPAADALRQARLRSAEERGRFARRRSEAREQASAKR